MASILDTSAWNRLLDDPSQNHLTVALAHHGVYPTALAISEICATENLDRQRQLLRLVKEVVRDFRPLGEPNQLAILACRAFSRGDQTIALTSGPDAVGAWLVINQPEILSEQTQRNALESNTAREKDFRAVFEKVRPELLGGFDSVRLPRPRSMREFLRSCVKVEQSQQLLATMIYQPATGKELTQAELPKLLESPYVRMLMVAYACAFYQRSIQPSSYGHRTNPGMLDLWSAVYLPLCDTFVTHDRGQRRTLRLLNKFNPHPTRVLSYGTWRDRILRPEEGG